MPETVLLIRNAAPGDFGGAETYQLNLAQVLKDLSIQPIIVSRSPRLVTAAKGKNLQVIKGWWWKRQNWSGYGVLIFPIYLLWQMLLCGYYAALIVRTSAHAIHIQSRDDFIAATFAGKLLRRRVIWTDHMDLRYIFLNIQRPLRNPVGKLVYFAARFTDKLILISQNENKLVTELIGARKKLNNLAIINNGIPDSLGKYKSDNTSGYFIYCLANRIVRNKGVGEAIEAFEILQRRMEKINNDIRLHIYGDGDELTKYRALTANNSHIQFFGHHADVLAKISSADVFVLPSYQEGLSLGLLEAMMLGKPIITTAVDSNPELITDRVSGLLVPARNPGRLADAMQELYFNSKMRERMAQKARSEYEEKYNLVAIVKDQIVPLYKFPS